MPVRETPWVPGTPCWVSLSTPDADAARAFYGGLFGWEVRLDAGSSSLLAEVGGRAVAGIGEQPANDPMPATWTTYLATADPAATAAAVAGRGGQLLVPPTEKPGLGAWAVGVDPGGASFGWWKSVGFNGVARFNEHGCLMWNELLTRDVTGALAFYTGVFGVTSEFIGDETFEYHTLHVRDAGADRIVGGIGGLEPDTPLTTPAHWLTYFGARDVDAAADLAAALGGSVSVPPHDTPWGRIAGLTGPAGEEFGVISLPVAGDGTAVQAAPESLMASSALDTPAGPPASPRPDPGDRLAPA